VPVRGDLMSNIICGTTSCPLKANPNAKFCSDCGSKRVDKEGPPPVLCDESPCGLRTDPTSKFCSECGDARSMKEDNPHARMMRDAQQAALDRRNLAMDEARGTRNYGGRMEEVAGSPTERHAEHLRVESGQEPRPEAGRPMTMEEKAAAQRRITEARIAAQRPAVPRDPRIASPIDENYRSVTTLNPNEMVEGELYDRLMPHGHGRTALQAGEGKHESGKLSAGGAKALPADYHEHVRVLEYRFNHSTHPVGTARAFAESRQRQMQDVAKKGNTNEWGFEKREGDEHLPSPEEVAAEIERKRVAPDQPRSKWLQDRSVPPKKKL